MPVQRTGPRLKGLARIVPIVSSNSWVSCCKGPAPKDLAPEAKGLAPEA
jgi:hypothetical protein